MSWVHILYTYFIICYCLCNHSSSIHSSKKKKNRFRFETTSVHRKGVDLVAKQEHGDARSDTAAVFQDVWHSRQSSAVRRTEYVVDMIFVNNDRYIYIYIYCFFFFCLVRCR